MEIISRQEARDKGLTRYFTGEPCTHGHIAQRQTINATCIVCSQLRHKVYYIKDKEKYSRRAREYVLKNKIIVAKRKHDWYEKNKPRILLERKQYQKDNSENLKKKAKEYRAKEDKAAKKAYHKAYRAKNRLYLNAQCRRRRRENLHTRILNNLRSRIKLALKGNPKLETTMKLMGCNIEDFKAHLQATAIKNGYTDFDIETYSGREYHIDHIIPCSSFNLEYIEEQRKCFHWSNLQILTATKNLQKGKQPKEDTMVAKKGSCGGKPRVGKKGDAKPSRRGGGARDGRGGGKGAGRNR